MMWAAVFGLELLIKATVLLLFAAGLSVAMRGRSAAERHLVWLAAVVALLVLPAVRGSGLGWEIPLPALGHPVHRLLAEPFTDARRRLVEPASLSSSGGASGGAGADVSAGSRSAPAPWFFLWSAGTALVLAWHGLSLIGAGHVVRRAEVCGDARILELLRSAVARAGLSRVPGVRLTNRLTLPAVAGSLRPVVLLPKGAAAWSDRTLTHVLLHELAHLRRADLFVSTLVRAACALYWPHPGIWAAARQLRKERERACDDAALRAGVDPHGYASCLLELAAAGRAGRRMPSTALAMARVGELEGRLVAVLDRHARRTVSQWPLSAACMVAAVAAGILLGATGIGAAESAMRGEVVSVESLPHAGHAPAARGIPMAPVSSGPRLSTTRTIALADSTTCDTCGPSTVSTGEPPPETTLSAYRGGFLSEARSLALPALRAHFRHDPLVTEAVLDEVAARAAHDLWMSLDVRITMPADSPRSGIRAWAEGRGRLSLEYGSAASTTAVVSSVMGPLPTVLPRRIHAALSVAGLQVRGAEERTLNEALGRAGADLERRWAAVITRRS